MQITTESTISDVAASQPSTVSVFQRHGIDFCCGGKRPIAEVCAERGLDAAALLGELQESMAGSRPERDWTQAPLTELVGYIQARFHEPLRQELPRLAGMMDRVVERHGHRHPDVLPPLKETLDTLQRELLDHMAKEDVVLFPAITAIEKGGGVVSGPAPIDQPIAVMEAEHEAAGKALARMRELTLGYMPPEGACPTFRGLYYGLAELEREMHVHVHLENYVLFPRAAQLADPSRV